MQAINRVNQILISMMMLALFSCGVGQSDAQLVATAKNYLVVKKIRPAAIELKNALLKNPKNAEARYLLGKIDLEVGDYEGAQKEFKRAQQSGWAKDQAQIGLAKALIGQRKFKRVLDDVSIRQDYPASSQAIIYALYASAQTGLGNIKLAQQNLNKAQAIDHNVLQLFIARVRLLFVENKWQQAASILTNALKQHPASAELLLLQAEMAIKNANNKLARSAYTKVITLDPKKLVTAYGRRARLGLVKLNLLERKFKSAQALLKPLFRQNKNDLELNYVDGLLAFQQGDLDRARQRLLRVLKVAPNHLPTQLLFGMVNFAQKDYEQAVYYLSKYVSTGPENIGARKLLGRAYMQLGQNSEAEKVLQSGLKPEKNDAELLALVGISQMQAGNLQAGLSGLEKAVNTAPKNAGLRSELAKAYITAGKTKKAIDELNTLISEGKLKEQSEILLVMAHLRAGQSEEAINAALTILSRHNTEPPYLTLVGNVFAATNDSAEAEKYFNKALQIDSVFVPAKMALARLAEQAGDTKKARTLYKSMVNQGKKSVRPLLALAALAEKAGKNTEMLSWLEQASQKAPRNIRPLRVLAEYYLHNKQATKADVYIHQALKVSPRDLTLLSMQARILTEQGQYNKAIPVLQNLVARAPDSVYLRSLLAEDYLKLGQVNDARHQLEISLQKQPYYIPALVLMVKMQVKAGHLQQALAFARTMQKVQPKYYYGYELSGDVLMVAKKYHQAETSYQQALQYKASAERLIKLAEANTRMGDSKQAQNILVDAQKKYPDNPQVLQFLGSIYLNNGENDRAINSFEKVLAKQHDNIVALNNLAWLYSLSGDTVLLKKAMIYAKKAYALKPEDAGIQDTYGWLLVQTGQAGKGLSILKQVIKVMPSVPEVQYHYAAALIKTGHKTEGKQQLIHLLKTTKAFVGRAAAEQLLR